MSAFKTFEEPTAAQIREQHARILSSKTFSLSKRQCKFLDFVVCEALEGRADKLKEFSIGIEVFGRDEAFDPRIDSIVRVEASRLRAKLRDYYDEEGKTDPIRIEVPKGQYAPAFHAIAALDRGEEPRTRPRIRRFWPLAGIAAAFAVLAVGYGAYRALQSSPTTSIPPARSAVGALNVAVLPLRDWSRDPEDYFSGAMTDTLIAALGDIPQLRVTSLTSVLRYKGTELPIPEIAEELSVNYIVEGSVFREPDRVRITAQLIDATNDKYLWSQTYDRPIADVLAVQQNVASDIAKQLAGELIPRSGLRATVVNPAAHEAYLKGRYFRSQLTADGFRKGIRFFQQATELQPDYAEAYAGLASCHCLLGGHGLELVAPVAAFPEARDLARKALSLDEGLAEPTAFLGIIRFKFEWDPDGAETLLKRAIELNPSYFEAYLWHSQILEATGRHDEAIERARDARRLNPLSLAAGLNLGWQLYQAARYIEAEGEFDKLVEFKPEFWGGHWGKAHSYRQQQMYDRAIDEFRQAVELEGGHSLPIAALGYTYAIAGRREEALRIVEQLRTLAKETYVSPFHVATVYAGLDEPDLVFEWLKNAYRVRARSLAWLAVTRELSGLRDDSRYKDLVNRIGIAAR